MNFIQKRLPALMKKYVLPLVGVLALVAFSAYMIHEAAYSTVQVTIDGESKEINTKADTVEQLLAELGIEVSEHDFLSMDLDEEVRSGTEIEYEEANNIYITVDGETTIYQTTQSHLGDFLKEENLYLSNHDHISHDNGEEIFNGLHVVINKAFEVTINDAGEEKTVWTTRSSVEDLLKNHDVKLPKKLDKIKPKLKTELTEENTITITRIKSKIETVEEALAFQTETKNDGNLKKGSKKTVTEGKKGKKVKEYEVIYENGEEVERKLLGEKVTEEPVNKVVAVGTKVERPKNLVTVSNSSSKSSGQPDGKVYQMRATAYTADCNGCSGITRTGINLKANRNAKVIAVDPSVIPLGSKVWVEGYGYAVAGDTGGAIKGNRIDIHVPTKAEAYRFGVRTVKVVLVK